MFTFRSQPSILCQVIGVVTHFLWLWMFSWSFMCSYHMYHVFTANTPTYSAGSTTHGLRKSVCGSFVLPFTAVIVVIVYSYWATQGRQVGYGNVMCYLDLPLFRGIFVTVPLLVITLVNVAFFLVAAYKIYGIRRLQTFSLFTSGSDFHVTVYVKLSTVTGAFWLVAILAEVLNNQPLQ
ncbi:adhesion G protein-coupled receptor E4P [Biomphalaria glabrata]|nr:putative adhesion G protein-coupled receptor E4P; partial [Biomphalaria glabrata]